MISQGTGKPTRERYTGQLVVLVCLLGLCKVRDRVVMACETD
jgi:hypothetical protein